MNHQDVFTAYLQGKDLAQSSITHYKDYTNKFFKRTRKDPAQVQKKDVLKHLQYLKERKGYENATRRSHLIALNHYFTCLYQAGQITENPCLLIKIRGTEKRSLYRTFTTDELTELCDNYYHSFVRNYNDNHIPKNQRMNSFLSKERNAVILSLLFHQGTTTKELDMLLLEDLDLTKATVKVRGGKKSNERMIPLKAEQIGLLIHYQNEIRPQIMELFTVESDKLFLPLPESGRPTTQSQTIMGVFKLLTEKVRTLDNSFLNFKQVRASVIVHWLKTVGLRKAQYLAGHRYISSTERYQPNNLEDLTNDIAKLHPF